MLLGALTRSLIEYSVERAQVRTLKIIKRRRLGYDDICNTRGTDLVCAYKCAHTKTTRKLVYHADALFASTQVLNDCNYTIVRLRKKRLWLFRFQLVFITHGHWKYTTCTQYNNHTFMTIDREVSRACKIVSYRWKLVL